MKKLRLSKQSTAPKDDKKKVPPLSFLPPQAAAFPTPALLHPASPLPPHPPPPSATLLLTRMDPPSSPHGLLPLILQVTTQIDLDIHKLLGEDYKKYRLVTVHLLPHRGHVPASPLGLLGGANYSPTCPPAFVY